MSIINQGINGVAQSDAFLERANSIEAQKQVNVEREKAHQLAMSKNEELRQLDGQVLKANEQTKMANIKAEKIEKEKDYYKEMLARPLLEILDENANLKKAYEEQQSLIALWMSRQRAMKKVALDLAANQSIKEEVVVEKAQENIIKIADGDDLNGLIDSAAKSYFLRHKNYILNNTKK